MTLAEHEIANITAAETALEVVILPDTSAIRREAITLSYQREGIFMAILECPLLLTLARVLDESAVELRNSRLKC